MCKLPYINHGRIKSKIQNHNFILEIKLIHVNYIFIDSAHNMPICTRKIPQDNFRQQNNHRKPN